MPSMKLTGDWDKAAEAMHTTSIELKDKLKMAIKQEALFFEGKIKEYLSNPAHFVALSPFTLKLRKLHGFKGTKPLNVSGALKGAVTVTPATPSLQHFVGIKRNARTKNGQSLVSIASVMENGATIVLELTAKMRRFLFGVLFKDEPKMYGPKQPGGGKRVIVIRIPPRPFIAPVFEQHGGEAGQRVYNRLALLLGGKLGGP